MKASIRASRQDHSEGGRFTSSGGGSAGFVSPNISNLNFD
jgi:hypothetical protein